MASFFEKLSEEDKAKTKHWAEERLQPKYPTDIPPELYVAAELGVYYGWGAIEAVLRGCFEQIEPLTGEKKYVPYTFEQMVSLAKAGRKAYYRKQLDAQLTKRG